MLKKGLKRIVIYGTAFACVMGMTACGKEDVKTTEQKESAENKEITLKSGVYKFDERVLYDDDEVYCSDFYMKGDYLYYTYTKYPEIDDEYMKLMMEKNGSIAGESLDDEDTEVVAEETDKKQEEKKVKEDEQPVSDDELLGDMDDIFYDENDADGETAENKGEDVSNNDEEIDELPAEYAVEIKFCRCNVENGEIEELYSEEESFASESTYYIDDNGNKISFVIKYDKDGETFYLTKKDKDGNIISDTEIMESLKESANGELYVDRSCFGDDGTLYCTVSVDEKTSVYKITVDGKDVSEVKCDTSIYDMFLDNDDKVIILVNGKDREGMSTECRYVDFDSKQIGEVVEGLASNAYMGQYYKGNANVSLLLHDGKVMYGYDSSTKTKQQLFDLVKSGLVAENIRSINLCDDGRIFCVCDDDGVCKLGFFVEQEGDIKEKTVIKIGSNYNYPMIQESIIEYNRNNSEYEIEYITYEDAEDPNVAFNNDIIAGNIPDVMVMESWDVENYIVKGMIEDLGPYIEKDDKINKDYFVDGILEATAYEGKNYFLIKHFLLNVLIGKESDLGKYNGKWVVKDLIELYKSKPKGTKINTYDYKEGFFSTYVEREILNFINWQTGEVNINCDEVRELLEFCNSLPAEDNYEGEIDYKKVVRNNEVLLLYDMFGHSSNLQIFRKLYQNDVAYIGYPSKKDQGVGLRESSGMFAISASSENKEAAWDFIKCVFEGDNEDFGFPTSKTEFEKMVKRDTATTSYTEEDGTVVYPREMQFGWNNYDVKINPATDEEIETLRNLIKNSKINFTDSSIIDDMIIEDVRKYFNGKKSLDETLKIIQDKLSKYVNENR